MNQYNKSLTLLTCGVLLASTPLTIMAEEEFHDADPRNTSWRGGIGASDEGEIKLAVGGGGSNLFDTDYQTQTNVLIEYYTDSENARLRSAHFDERFGGVYIDYNHISDAIDFYSAGYMLPLDAGDNLMLFPSVNYTYVDFDTDGLAKVANEACNFANSSIVNACGTLEGLGGASAALIEQVIGNDDSAHMGSVNFYALKPWNANHYTVINANLGSSFDGVEMNVANLMWLQGIKTKLGDNILNIYFEVKYDVIEIEPTGYTAINNSTFKSEETTGTIGFDFRF